MPITTVKDMIAGLGEKFSPKFMLLAKFIESHYDDVAFQSSAWLASQIKCSEATVSRFAAACGFSGYGEMQAAMQKELRERVALPKYVPNPGQRTLLHEIAAMEKSIIDEMLAGIPDHVFEEAVDRLFAASRLFAVGTHLDAVPAMYVSYYLSAFRPDVRLVTEVHVGSFNALHDLKPGAVVIAYSFPRYPKLTLEILEDLKRKGAYIIGITDLRLAPLAEYADLLLLVPTKYASYIDPQAAIMTLNHSLMMGVIMKNRKQYQESIKDYDEYMTRNDVFVNADIDVMDLTLSEPDK